MGEKTSRNLYEAFVGEAKAHFPLLAYAEKAEEEELSQIRTLFRAVAEAERVHTTSNLGLLGEVVVKDTETNLQASFQREGKASGLFYPRFIREAEEEGDRRAAIAFSQAGDVEEGHATLYKHALRHMLADTARFTTCERYTVTSPRERLLSDARSVMPPGNSSGRSHLTRAFGLVS